MSVRGKLLAVSCWAAMLSHGLGMTIFGPLVSLLEEHFGVGKSSISLVYGAMAVGFLLSVTVGGWLLDTLGNRWILVLGGVGFAAALFVFTRADLIISAMASYFFVGAAGGILQIGANAGISTAFSRNRALFLNLLHVFFGLGAILGPRLAPWTLHYGGGWRSVYAIPIVTAALTCLFALLGDMPPAHPENEEKEACPETNAMTLLRSGSVMLIVAAIITYVGAEVSLTIWGPVYLEEFLSFSKSRAAAEISGFWIAMVIGRVICVRLARVMKTGTLLRLLMTGAAIALIAFLSATSPPLITITLIIGGLFCSGAFPTIMALAGDLHPRVIPAITSIVMVAAASGNLAFPWLIGIAGDKINLFVSMLTVVILMVVSAGFAYRLSQTAATR